MRAYSIANVLNARFHTLEFEGKWFDAVGCPELAGSWMIYGPPKNGKTTFAMQLAKYLCRFRRVAYNSQEEGLSKSIQMAMERVGMSEVGGRLVLLDKEPVDDLVARLSKHKSPDIIINDSLQFMELTFRQYKLLKAKFPKKLFIYISHIDGKQPDGNTAKKIWRDCSVYFRIEGYRAFPQSRFGGGTHIDVFEEKAKEYWT
ncbi:MAG: hypothetical protein ACOXZH_00205 [Bacteroidales bacterium]|jgi:hypothetical protein|nr:hypothetical protein [Bacteroidales bacterium]